jgi:signal transduction histidine kinase
VITTLQPQINAAKIRASNDAKGNFLASMSHEMRTPLNGVLGMLQLAMSYDLPHEVMQVSETTTLINHMCSPHHP